MTDHPEDLAPCIRGCVRAGSDDLLPARHGLYCNRCYYQYVRALNLAVDVVEHVWSLVTFQGRSGDHVDSSREAPVPFNLQAFHDANETFRRLAYWASVWAGRLGDTLPSTVGKVWRDGHGRVAGIRRGAPAHQAKQQTRVYARWLLDRLDRILELPKTHRDVDDDLDFWRDELADVFRVSARWPRDPQPRYSDMPCTDDDCSGRIAVYPPLEFGDDERIVCERCGRHYAPGDYEFLIRLFQQVQRDRVKAARTARRLAEKYGFAIGGR